MRVGQVTRSVWDLSGKLANGRSSVHFTDRQGAQRQRLSPCSCASPRCQNVADSNHVRICCVPAGHARRPCLTWTRSGIDMSARAKGLAGIRRIDGTMSVALYSSIRRRSPHPVLRTERFRSDFWAICVPGCSMVPFADAVTSAPRRRSLPCIVRALPNSEAACATRPWNPFHVTTL